MTKNPDPSSAGYTNAILEDMNHKIQIILEATQPIPEMQKTGQATFEEVGNLRVDVDTIKLTIQDVLHRLEILEGAMKLLERDTTEVKELKNRVTALEKVVQAK